MRALAPLAAAATAGLHLLAPGACHSRSQAHRAAAGGPPKDEVWLSDVELERLRVTTEEVRLEDVDETLLAVGPVVARDECPVKGAPEERKSCVVVAVEQSTLARVHVGSAATVRAADLVHEIFSGQVAWIAGALDPSGRTVKVACIFPDPMAELRAGKPVRLEIVVGARPAFAVSRAAVMRAHDGSFVFASAGSTDDGRHRFARVPVRTEGDTGGPWLPVADLQPGSVVVKNGTQALASMLAVTAL